MTVALLLLGLVVGGFAARHAWQVLAERHSATQRRLQLVETELRGMRAALTVQAAGYEARQRIQAEASRRFSVGEASGRFGGGQ